MVAVPSNSSHDRCPHLGLGDDETTAFAFSSRWNHCYKAEPIAVPSLEHQRLVCLGEYHACPVFLRDKKGTFPESLREKIKKRRPLGVYFGIIILLAFISVVLLNYFGVLAFPTLDVPDVFPSATTVVIQTKTAVRDMATETPSPTKTALPDATNTMAPPVSLCAYPFDSVIGNEQRFVVHQVVAGENISVLALQHESAPEALGAVNLGLEPPLRAGTVIVIPIRTESIDALFPLRAVQVDESDLSIKEMAEKLGVDVADMMELNYQDASCRDFQGWLLIPAGE